jgi:hypothetical protein
MIHTIRWMVMREPEADQYRIGAQILFLFLLGGLTGGAVAGGMVAFVGYLLFLLVGSHLVGFALASSLVGVAYIGQQLGWWRLPRLSLSHQVPEAWRNIFAPKTASFLYSGALGLTFFTRISSYALYPFLVLLLGLGRWPWAAILLFVIAGFTRSATALLVPVKRWAYSSATVVTDELEPFSSIIIVTRTLLCVAASASLLVWVFLSMM